MIFVKNFPFLTNSFKPLPQPLNSQNPLSTTKVNAFFVSAPLMVKSDCTNLMLKFSYKISHSETQQNKI